LVKGVTVDTKDKKKLQNAVRRLTVALDDLKASPTAGHTPERQKAFKKFLMGFVAAINILDEHEGAPVNGVVPKCLCSWDNAEACRKSAWGLILDKEFGEAQSTLWAMEQIVRHLWER
jgi:hypothetical protein